MKDKIQSDMFVYSYTSDRSRMADHLNYNTMDVTSLFLGPKSENNETFKHFFEVIVEDILNFRNNYHPDEPPIISEKHKLSQPYLHTRAAFMQELKMILGKLRAHSVPSWDTSYIAHMNSDLIYPAIAGYISTIMYNPNNVTGEVSTVTTQWEMDFIGFLSKMVGYPKFSALEPKHKGQEAHSWGHITSGGTVANIEGLWVARNLKYLPLSLKLAIEDQHERLGFLNDIQVPWFNGEEVAFGKPGYDELFRLSPDLIYRIVDMLKDAHAKQYPKSDPLNTVIKPYSLQYLGIPGIHAAVQERSGFALPYPRVIIAQTKHYCWEKSMEVLGLGMKQLVTIPVDQNYKLDIQLLEQYLDENPKEAILAVIPIIGTTEEGVMDPMHRLVALRQEMERKSAGSFYIHADAAYGGYFASVFSSGDFEHLSSPAKVMETFIDGMEKMGDHYVTEEGFRLKQKELDSIHASLSQIATPLASLRHADSITIDPHKLGYIPYPAGSVLFKNYKAKELISFEAPYLKWSGDTMPGTERIFIGQSTLEGSRPGAAASACYLASKIVPLNITGYGKIMLYNMIAAQKFFKTIPEEKENTSKIIPQYYPDTNVVCYCISYPGVVEHPKYLNLLANKVFDNMTKKMSKQTASYEYFISKTNINYDKYAEQINQMFKQAHIPEENYALINQSDGGEFLVLRSVLMNPLALGLPDDYYSGFWQRVQQLADEGLEDVLDDIIKTKFNNQRVKILWIENRKSVEKLKNAIETSGLGRYFSFSFLFDNDTLCDFVYRANEDMSHVTGEADIVITDLCLDGSKGPDVDISRMHPIIRRFSEQKKEVICYSKYLSADHSDAPQIKKDITEAIGRKGEEVLTGRIHFVGKESPFEAIEEVLTEGLPDPPSIFDTDISNLIKKLILALQRVEKAGK